MDETVVTFTVPNLITITLMGLIGFAVIGLVAQVVRRAG